jgi:hypothetical protein
MNAQVISEYLVRLGFAPDEPSFKKLQDVLARADSAVEQHTSGMIKNLLKAQLAIISGFTAVSGAIIGMIDKVAMADQSFRLFSLRMMMTQESGKKLKMITDALGASIEEIYWDKELHEQARQLSADFDHMSANLGKAFGPGMKDIRAFRFEFVRLRMEFEFLQMSFVQSLWQKLGLGDARQKLHEWVTEMQDRIPHIADKLATTLVPVLKATWEMWKSVGEMAKEFAVIFTNIVGLLTGDTSIEGTTFDVDKLSKAIENSLHWLELFFKVLTWIETVLAHIVKWLTYLASYSPTGKLLSAINTYISKEDKENQATGSGSGSSSGSGSAAAGGFTGMDPTVLDKIALAIQNQEGYRPGTLAYRQNNPGNLRFDNQAGAVRGERGFAKFASYEAGFNAEKRQIALDAGRGMSLHDLIYSWAPPKENDTASYLRRVSASTGINPAAKLSEVRAANVTVNNNVKIELPKSEYAPREFASAIRGQMDQHFASRTQWDQVQIQPLNPG